MILDKIDKRILIKLQENARISNAELSRTVNLSQPAVFARVKKLEDHGIIKKYIAVLNTEYMEKKLLAFLYLKSSNEDIDMLTNFFIQNKNVIECHESEKVSHFILRLRMRELKDIRLFMKELYSIDKSIEIISLQFISETIKQFTDFSDIISS